MKRIALAVVFLLISAATVFAQDGCKKKEPDTIFQKVATYSKEGYKADTEPIKKVSMFQYAADWVTGDTTDDRKGSVQEKPSLFWK